MPAQERETMLGWLRGKRATNDTASVVALSAPLARDQMAWLQATRLPIPDWERQTWPQTQDDAALHAHANGMAAAWIDATAAVLPQGYHRSESDNFMLLSSLEERPARLLLDYLERSRRRVLATLPGITADHGHGKTVVMVFAGEDSYYDYVAHYGSESSEPEAFSGGMFIDAGYGHFVFAQGPFESMEPVVVHELTHCLVRHLDIPAWLNEGLAVNTEHRFTRASPRWRPNELRYLMEQFWTPQTIQEFWTGASFRRPDDGQPLSYELAKLLVQLLDKDYELLARYCNAASREDGGAQAALEVLGTDLAELAACVLGPGDWLPQPVRWSGTEKGQF
jgi:hypothetical protein